jgi:Zn-dependent protease
VIGQSIRLGKIWGIPVGINASWFIVFVLLTLSLTSQFAHLHPRWSPIYHYTIGIITSLLFFASVLLHELGHSAIALRKHIPIRSITLFVFGGIAQLGKEPDRPLTELQIAIAGPIVSVVLSVVFGMVGTLAAGTSEGVQTLGQWLGWINLSLALFNLIPGFPLDGGRVFRALVWGRTGDFARATRIAGGVGKGVAYLFIMSGIWIALGGALVDGLWITFIGWFLLTAAETNVQQVALKQALAGLRARDVMTPDCPSVPDHMSLSQLVEDYLLLTGRRCFLVTTDGQLLGLITVHQVKNIPHTDWPHTSVRQAMVPLARLHWVAPDAEVSEVLALMDDGDVGQVPVVRDGQLLGLIGRDHLLRVIRAHLEFRA